MRDEFFILALFGLLAIVARRSAAPHTIVIPPNEPLANAELQAWLGEDARPDSIVYAPWEVMRS